MSSRGTYRRHSSLFKIRVCEEIRSGGLVRRGAMEKYNLSANLVQRWLRLYDRGELVGEEAEAAVPIEYEAKIAALERKVGQLTSTASESATKSSAQAALVPGFNRSLSCKISHRPAIFRVVADSDVRMIQ